MFWNSKKKLKQKFEASWGKPKNSRFKFDLIKQYFQKTDNSSAWQIISDQTINDLDFYSLFSFADRTSSSIGQQYLFNKLLTVCQNPDFEEQEQLIDMYSKNDELRLQSQIILSKLSDQKSYSMTSLFLEDFENPPKYFTVIKILSIISLVVLILSFFIPKLFLLLISIFAVNLYIHYVNKKYTEMFSESIPRLSILCSCVRRFLKCKLPFESETVVKSSLKSLDELKNALPLFTIEADQIKDPFVAALHILLEYIKIQFLLEPIIVFNVLKQLREKRNDIQNLFVYFGTIDSAISIASLRHGLKYYCQPTLSQEHKIFSFTGIYHPLVPDCIPNSMEVKDKSILLTGSNMSGKTTFIRSVSINTLFAQTINTCFASSFTLSSMKIFSAIRISDDVLSGKSYYFEEVLTIHEMIKASQTESKTLFLLDEIFKGTNTIERIAAGKAVLSYMSKNNNLVFVSTHDIELTSLLKDEYELYHFTEVIENDRIHFDYTLKNGALKTRNAIKILEINDYPKKLINEAKEISNKISGNSSKTV